MNDLGMTGQLYLVEDTQRLTQQFNPGMTKHVIQLNTFTKFAYNLRFIIRAVSSLTPNYLDKERFRLISLDTSSG